MTYDGASYPGPVTALALSLRGVVKTYGKITAVDGMDLDVPEGTVVKKPLGGLPF